MPEGRGEVVRGGPTGPGEVFSRPRAPPAPPEAALPSQLVSLNVRDGHPDFLDLPWTTPLVDWPSHTTRLVEVSRGVSRHEVRFLAYADAIYAVKELPERTAAREYDRLRELEAKSLPSVTPVGLARVRHDDHPEPVGLLVTRFLDGSLPFRTLFAQPGLERYRDRLLDAMAGLLVRLHLAGFFWGDCSLSNTLFKRDGGELAAWLVDAETAEHHAFLSDELRAHDLDLLRENVAGELADVRAEGLLPDNIDPDTTANAIGDRYKNLWDEISREVVIAPDERFRIHERIKALNDLGFSVREVELVAAADGQRLRMRTVVTDREYHRHQLHTLTGLVATERQARLILNEILEMQATLSRTLDRSLPRSVASFRWLEERFQPTIRQLQPLVKKETDLPELYCDLLEHKWIASEKAGRDVGLEAAVKEYLRIRTGGP